MELKNILFTELISKFVLTDNEEYEKEIRRRLKFCSFDEDSIFDIIRLEMKIVEFRKLYYNSSLMSEFSLLNFIELYKNNKDYKLISMPPDRYAQLDNQEVLNSTLSISELTILYTDGLFLNNYSNILNVPENMIKDINDTIIDHNKAISTIKKIYVAKFDLIYMLNHDMVATREFLQLASRFFRNEAQIVARNKWEKIYGFKDVNGINFEPYTIDYFKYYELR